MKKQWIKWTAVIGLGFLLFACNTQNKSVFTDTVAAIDEAAFNQTIDEKPVALYTLTNNSGMGMKVTNFGARVVALCVPDADGKPVDVVLGYNTLDEYVNRPENFLGAAIGRYGNRIGGAQFTIDSMRYELTKNEGNNQLHGGPKGFFDVVWNAQQLSSSEIEFTYVSVDGEAGYPGNLSVTMVYELTPENGFKITYHATTDKTTICNLTHHSYFNLSGEGSETINDHILTIRANGFTPVDSTLIPTGRIAPVNGTAFDFNQPVTIGARVNEEDQQLVYGAGYDHNWVLNKESKGIELVASLYSPISQIKMEVLTDQPGLQFYGGNFIDGTLIGKSGKVYPHRSAVCLETQHFPDSPNKANFPSTLLKPDQTYSHTCEYRFSVE
ncbi:MAG: aldose epimerase family protein [Salinivirgaceae bacterium]